MKTASPAIDTKCCPLCGKPNRCAMAANPAAKSCWCAGVEVNLDAIEALPPDKRNLACLCQECLTGGEKATE